jgi:hypothetical protein
MKKTVLLLIAVIATCLMSFGQFKPESGFTTELQFSPFAADPFSTMGISGRYFINENMAIRLNLDFGVSTDKEVTVGTGSMKDAITKTTNTNFGITPGFEYHFGKFERVSPYVGAKIGFETSSEKRVEDDPNDGGSKDVTKNWNGTGQNHFTFGVGVGTDVYIWQGLYVGAEVGFGLRTTSFKDGKMTSTPVSGSGTTNEQINKDSGIGVGFRAEPRIRLGWCF